MPSAEQSEARQFVLPDFQGPLKIHPGSEDVAASHVENLTGTEGIVSIKDVKRVAVDLGIATPETVEKAIMAHQRKAGFSWISDTVAGIMMIKLGIALDLSGVLKRHFEERYGVPFTLPNLYEKALGGVDINPQEANLVRDAEDEALDQQKREELRTQEQAYIDECLASTNCDNPYE